MDTRLRGLERQIHSGDSTAVAEYLTLKNKVSISPLFCVRSQTGSVQHLVKIIGSGLRSGYTMSSRIWRAREELLGIKTRNRPITIETACGQERMRGWETAEDYNRRHHFSEIQPTCKNCLRSQFFTYHLKNGEVPYSYILRTNSTSWHLAYPPFLFNQYRTRCGLSIDHDQRFMLYPGSQYGIQQEIDNPHLWGDVTGDVFCGECRKTLGEGQ